jgi:hypothetical protein
MDVLDFTDLELELACQDKSFADELALPHVP